MIMKKFLALLLALTMLVAFAGCETEEPAATEETLPAGIMTYAEFEALLAEEVKTKGIQ